MTNTSPTEPLRSVAKPDAPLSLRRGVAVGIVIVLVGVGFLAADLLTDESVRERGLRNRGAEPAVPGSTCPLLARAADLLDAGDDGAFHQAVRDASRSALRTLDRSGQTFGGPERVAVQLGYDVGSGDAAAITAGLEKAERACSELGRWPGG